MMVSTIRIRESRLRPRQRRAGAACAVAALIARSVVSTKCEVMAYAYFASAYRRVDGRRAGHETAAADSDDHHRTKDAIYSAEDHRHARDAALYDVTASFLIRSTCLRNRHPRPCDRLRRKYGS